MNVWIAVNKNGFIGMYAKEPKRNEQTGKWECKYCVCNSIVYKEICNLAEKAKMTWINEPELLEI